jgi:GMP synthase (glutamine-hydrolysing)
LIKRRFDTKMIIIVDNSKNCAIFTPKLIELTRKIVAGRSSVKVVKTLRAMRKLIIDNVNIEGVILGGGPLQVSGPVEVNDYSKNIVAISSLQVPVLGICFGMQIMSMVYGSCIKELSQMENGMKKCQLIVGNSDILKYVPNSFICCQAHKDVAYDVPVGFEMIAVGEYLQDIQCIERKKAPYRAGTQFHIEGSGHIGEIIMSNFLNKCF